MFTFPAHKVCVCAGFKEACQAETLFKQSSGNVGFSRLKITDSLAFIGVNLAED